MAGSGVLPRVRAIRGLPGVLVGYGVFIVAEYAEWVAVLVYAYDRGGATEAGLIALAQLVPAAIAAPALGAWSTRFRPGRVLQAGYAALALALVIGGVGVLIDVPALAYGAAVASAFPIVMPRPAQVAVLTELAGDPHDLTAGSVALGWAESFGVVGAGLMSGVVLTAAGPGWLLVCTAALAVGSLVATVPAARATRHARVVEPSHLPSAREASSPDPLTTPWRSVHVLIALLTMGGVLIAALDVLFVVLAVDVLERGEGWAGYLQMVFGLGAVASAPVTARLVGRRLAPAIVVAALLTGAVLAVTAPGPGLVVTVVAVTIAGAGRAVFDVASRTLLLRITPYRATARVFGVVEGCTMAGLAGGSLLVPVLVAAGGSTVALLGAATLLPLAVVVTAVRLSRLDVGTPDQGGALAALRASPLFEQLTSTALEALAGAAEPTRQAAGTVLIREGEPGHDYHLLTEGEVEVSRAGRVLRRLGPGEGIGEIALLRRSPRTATVTALTELETLRIDGQAFLDAVTGHHTTLSRVTQQAERWQPSDSDDESRAKEDS